MLLNYSLLIAGIGLLPSVTALRSETKKDASMPVYGWCDFNWKNTHQVTDVRCGAWDQACDAHYVYTELYLYSDNSATVLEKKLAYYKNDKGCGTQNWDTGSAHSWDNLPRSNIFKARTRSCVHIQGLGDDVCYWGNIVDNPYTAG